MSGLGVSITLGRYIPKSNGLLDKNATLRQLNKLLARQKNFHRERGELWRERNHFRKERKNVGEREDRERESEEERRG